MIATDIMLLEAISNTPLRRPSYVSHALTIHNAQTWIEVNSIALRAWYEALLPYDGDADPVDFDTFALCQYDLELERYQRAAEERAQRQAEFSERFSNFDRDTGIRRYGEI